MLDPERGYWNKVMSGGFLCGVSSAAMPTTKASNHPVELVSIVKFNP
jgi:hypothetical protein